MAKALTIPDYVQVTVSGEKPGYNTPSITTRRYTEHASGTGRTLQISILIMNLQKPRKYDVVKSSVFPMTGNVQNGISELKSHQ